VLGDGTFSCLSFEVTQLSLLNISVVPLQNGLSNAGGEPVVIRECKKRCDEGTTTTRVKDKKGKLRAIDPNALVLTPDN
jgi:hypothetical protein